MEKTYSPASIEQRWYTFWEESGYFSSNEADNTFCIMIPPPNVTGSLHMGHAFQDTIMDALIRFHRMQGFNTLWQPGTDHAGIATQMVVERIINAEGKTRFDYGREQFVDKVWEWKKQSGDTITRQLRRMGSSLDWEKERFTMDEGMSDAVQEVFIQLYSEDLIYRGKRLVNWDPVLHTAVSDLEVLSEEENGFMWYIRYPLVNETGHLLVATTRPETLLGDAAVAVHPDDERYKHLIGQYLTLPLSDRLIPIIADDYVDPEFGTGCVKITPAHDFNDNEVWHRHKDKDVFANLPENGLINIFTPDAAIIFNADLPELIPTKYIGLDRYEARKQIVADLDSINLLEKVIDHKLMVPRGDRSGAVIEPFLTNQWYVKIGPLAEPAIAAVESGTIKFVPDNWKNTYFDWMKNIQDWCISRQIWWGHRIPAWYDDADNIYVGKTEAEIRSKFNLPESTLLTQDNDVLDTWFSSALWPFSTLGWPNQTADLSRFYPTSVLVTGFDIIFFWVARMIMMGLKFQGEVPFREVYIHGLVRDAEGQKMSKSKGNVLDPIDIIDGIDLDGLVQKRISGMMQPHLAQKIEQATRKQFPDGIAPFGTDALRFTFASLASTGRDIRFDLARTEGYRNFCNKLWNASRYVLMNTNDNPYDFSDLLLSYSLPDKWIQIKFNSVVISTTDAIKKYRFDLAAQQIYDFTWNEFCDWYLEFSKISLQSANLEQQRGTRKTLLTTLESLLRLAHPIIPFITEEIWQQIAPLAGITGATIMIQPYPVVESIYSEIEQERINQETNWIIEFLLGIRRIRGEMNISPSKPLSVLLENGTNQDKQFLENNLPYLLRLGRLETIRFLDFDTPAPESAIALVGELKILIPMAGLIDKSAELARLQREIDRIQNEILRIETKLNNNDFVAKAPHQVITKERDKLSDFNSNLNNLQNQHETINKI